MNKFTPQELHDLKHLVLKFVLCGELLLYILLGAGWI